MKRKFWKNIFNLHRYFYMCSIVKILIERIYAYIFLYTHILFISKYLYVCICYIIKKHEEI